MAESIYRQLQKQLDQYSMGFPATDSRIEIKILKHLFSDEDAKMFTLMTEQLETPKAVAERLGLQTDKVAQQLEDMTNRGLLFRVIKSDRTTYSTTPYVHGIFEFQTNNLNLELSSLMVQYFRAGFYKTWQKSAEYFLRTVPVQESVDASSNVAPFDDAVAILKSKSKIVITDCTCRKQARLLDHGCGAPLETCFMFDDLGQYYLDKKMGREIQLDEAIKILNQSREDGLVTQPTSAQDPDGMCNCCSDCCGQMTSIKAYPKPTELVISNYLSSVISEDCSGCKICLDRCPMGARSIIKNGTAEVDKDRCIGCGLCVTTCPTEAAILVRKQEKELRLPPQNVADRMAAMTQKRGLKP